MKAIPVGVRRELVASADVRSPQQQQAVTELIGSPDFAYALNNPFVDGIGDYCGPFTFLWYTTDGTMHARRIGKLGRTLREVTNKATAARSSR